jgi:predicted O-methyltransferase YrrM
MRLDLGWLLGRGPEPDLESSRLSPRGRRVAAAIARRRLPPPAEAYAARIEAVRAELSGSADMLGAWDRPWLARSPELRARLKLDQADDRFESSIPVRTACEASKPPKWCRALMAMVLDAKPAVGVEMGTNLGISGLYIAAGMTVNGQGKLITMEGAPSKAAVAAGLFERLAVPAEVVVGDFADTLAAVLAQAQGVGFAFIDGFHEGAATVRYHEAFKGVARQGAILVYDDINWSEGMKDAWATIRTDPEVGFALDYGAIGVCGLKEA